MRSRCGWTRAAAAIAMAAAVFVIAWLVPAPLAAQRGQPRTTFTTSDFARLRWLTGTWRGSAPGEREFYERYQFANDSTIEITYFDDSALTRATGRGRVYLAAGRIYHTFGAGRWAASHVGERGVYFVPQANAQNTFAWSAQSADAWTATLRTGVSGHDRVVVYQMRRVQPRH